jgi:hypothetical protein
MPNAWSVENRLQNADCIVANTRQNFIFRHYAVYFNVNDEEFVIENTKEAGVVKTSINDYLKKYPEYLKIIRFNGSDEKRKEVYSRALSQLGKSFDWLTNNCEMTANYILKGIKYSGQEIILGVGVIIAIMYVIKK